MKYAIIFFSFILPNLAFTEILEKFPLACICDKSINALKYFDCKQKVSGTQLDIIENKKNKNVMIFSSFDEKNYQLFDEDNLSLIFNYDTDDYISSISIKENLDLVFGSRYEKDANSFDDDFITRIGNFIFTFLGNFLMKLNL